jgi:alkyldihydroxyacetonephosphate synthase
VDASAYKWWGWAAEGKRAEVSDATRAAVSGELGLGAGDVNDPVPLETVKLPDARPLLRPVEEAAGEGAVLTDPESRIRRAAGRSYPDLIRLRTGVLENAPDAVIVPDSRERLAAVISACSEAGVAVVPFGGGTSVVGGVEAIAGDHPAVVSIDLGKLRDVGVDRTSLTARLGPGLRGPEAEQELNALGMTLGHFPQSYEQATIGGYAATRSAGQASTGYGRFDELVTSLELTSPAGPLRTLPTPHTAAGPSLRELVLGSEGTLGVISEVTCRVHPDPEEKRYEGWVAADFASGTAIMRELAQHGETPDVLRLSDEEETRVSLEILGSQGAQKKLLDAYLGLRRRRGGCLLICGYEGERESVHRRRAVASRRLRAGGAVSLGTRAGSSWQHARFEGPYLRDELIGLGAFVETLETAHTWSRLPELYAAVGDALRGALGPSSIVFCHISHVYEDGASLYFTFLTRARRGEEIEQWRAIKATACEAIVATEGTITHHHAVGRDHAPYMAAEVGELGLDALRAVKEQLDPAGVMNPGKLLPPA